MNKKLFLIFALAFLCFALPRVAAQENESENELGEMGENGVDTETPNVDEEAPIGGEDDQGETGETGETDGEVIVSDEEAPVDEGDVEEEAPIEEEDDTEVVVEPPTDDNNVNTPPTTGVNVLSAPVLVGSTAVLAVSALLLF